MTLQLTLGDPFQSRSVRSCLLRFSDSTRTQLQLRLVAPQESYMVLSYVNEGPLLRN